MKISLGIEYDGSQFHGWQKQPSLRAVQSEVESALSSVANHPIHVFCAGRTDAGVHAIEQIVHFETSVSRPVKAWCLGANTYLPSDVVVKWSSTVSDDFHARFSALSRTYVYRIDNRAVRTCLYRNYATWIPKPLNVEAMQEGASCLLGEHDFSSFRGADCQSLSPCRRIDFISIKRQQSFVFIEITANAFLQHMVRNIVGVLVAVGSGREPVEWVKEVLEKKDRTCADVTLAPQGLFLMKVQYPNVFELPSQSLSLHF
ncbi:MAG: tRNA pseudouridine(38-40) synthase TruA [Gammaproteobacteria bacterium]|nr:tRNA pseudouridine(38-40) synthase TruA [Gammaproteobacteria bacterium]MBU1559050.1 tRNA pseudouridine(38-40) synthase TruA [Gammaproteobacteria bacterium]MBU1926143.1 tRNA pseudouridine(38-40) synthase TruA [Gammaproteobacteria bacterium]